MSAHTGNNVTGDRKEACHLLVRGAVSVCGCQTCWANFKNSARKKRTSKSLPNVTVGASVFAYYYGTTTQHYVINSTVLRNTTCTGNRSAVFMGRSLRGNPDLIIDRATAEAQSRLLLPFDIRGIISFFETFLVRVVVRTNTS